MSNIEEGSDKFSYSLKLDGLEEKELFYLSNSLGIQKTDNKNDIINNIINKLNTLPKDEFDKMTEIINKLLIEKKNNANEKDDNNNNDNDINNDNNNKFNNDNGDIQEKNIFYDKIFLFYAPKVNLNSKIRFFYYCCCCCCSFSVETIIKILFILGLVTTIISFLINLFSTILNGIQQDFHQILISQIFNGLLFVSTKNNNINFARYALLYKEYMFLYSILNLKKTFAEINEKTAKLLLVCNENDEKSFYKCIVYTIVIYIVYFILIIDFIPKFFEIYIAYYQLALIKIKKFKKL
jgi:hypothetical protein